MKAQQKKCNQMTSSAVLHKLKCWVTAVPNSVQLDTWSKLQHGRHAVLCGWPKFLWPQKEQIKSAALEKWKLIWVKLFSNKTKISSAHFEFYKCQRKSYGYIAVASIKSPSIYILWKVTRIHVDMLCAVIWAKLPLNVLR